MKHRIAVFGLILLAIGAALMLGRQWSSMSEPTAPAEQPSAQVVAPPTAPVELAVAEAAAHSATAATTSETGATLRGRVIDAVTRKPLHEFEVTLTRVVQGHIVGDESQTAKTFKASDGRFAWLQAPVGDWSVTVAAPRYQRFRVDSLSISAGKATREVVMPMQRGHVLKGRVFDQVSGAGIADARIDVREPGTVYPDWTRRRFVASEKDGTFEIDGVPGGEMIVSTNAHRYARRDTTVMVSDDMPPLEIGLATGGKIAGMVVAPNGMPAQGYVNLAGPGIGQGGSKLDETGGFSFTNRPAGSYRLVANTDAGSANLELELAENEIREDVVLRIGAGRSLRGVVRGLRPEQLEHAYISVWPESTRAQIGARPDGEGAYTVNGLPPGRTRVTMDVHMSHHFDKTIDVPADEDVVLDIVFPPGVRLSGRITQAAKPVTPTTVWVTSADGKGERGYRGLTGGDGRYEIQAVPPGEYRVTVHEGTGRAVTIASDTVVDIDMPLVELGGRIVEDGGTVPIVGVGVHVIGTEAETARVVRYKESDDFGRFRLIGLEPGELLLSVYKPGYEMHREKIVYSSPITSKTITLRKSAGVKVNVSRASFGGPLERFFLKETLPNSESGIGLWVTVDGNGVGYLPGALAGSSLKIMFSGARPVVIEKWNGQSLDLKL